MLTGQRIDETFQHAIAHYRSGDLTEAERICREVLHKSPANGDALHLLGLTRLVAADYASARDFLQRAAFAAPDDHLCHYNLGEAYRCLGLFTEAVESYEKAIALRPAFAEARNNLGIVLADLGLFDAAIESYEQALLTAPDSTRTLMNLGNVLIGADRFPEAITCFGRVIALDADCMEAYHGFCRASGALERPGEELTRLVGAIGSRSGASSMLNNLGEALQDLDRTDEALSVYDGALLVDPYSARTHHSRGLLLESLGRIDEAYGSLKRAVHLEPDRVEAHDDLGRFCYEQGLFDEAKEHFQAAVDRNDGFAIGHSHLGAILAREGLLGSAAEHYEKADALDPRAGVKVLLATLVPVIPRSAEEIRSARVAVERNIDNLSGQGLSIDDPFRNIGKANFFLAYQGLDDRDIQMKLARFYESICPSLAFVASHCKSRREPEGARRIKIGFLSRHLRNHTIGQYMRGLIAHLDRDAFEVHLFLFPHKKDEIKGFIEERADSVTLLPDALFVARRVVAEKKLDILFYPDIGMEPFTYFLAFSRLAPVQCAFYGHPITTGIRTIDYFISHADCEIPEGDAHYSESLVKLSEGVTYAYYYRPPAHVSKKERGDFSIADSDHVYLCAQSLFKVHPDFDGMLQGILSKDEEGLAVFFQGEHATWTDLLTERLRESLGDNINRVRFLPRQSYEEYLRLVALSDVILDTPHFNGGATTFDALAKGVPIVTLPGAYMRGRQTYSLYKRMGVMDCIVNTPQEYVDKAVRLATDVSYREEIRRKICANSHLIFEDVGMVRELERHLKAMVREVVPNPASSFADERRLIVSFTHS
jgi:predicted O-linked N-acetylglucosamine transferase (SPINDLY family)